MLTGAPRAFVNAGDGRHAHPTQGLLDLYTIRHTKSVSLATVAIGSTFAFRAVALAIHWLTTPHAGRPVIGPKTLLPSRWRRWGRGSTTCATVGGCDAL